MRISWVAAKPASAGEIIPFGGACAKDPAALHGPYYEWVCMKDGRLRHRALTPEQAKPMRRAVANYHKVRRLLRLPGAQTQQLIGLNDFRK